MIKFFFSIPLLLMYFFNPWFVALENGKESLSLSFSVDPVVHADHMTFHLDLKNNTKQTVDLHFPTTQLYEIVVKNPEGENLYVFSADKSFAQMLTTISVEPGKTVEWEEKWENHQLPEGDYEVVAELKANKPVNLTDKKVFQIANEQSAFKGITVSGKQGKYEINGLANVDDSFFYSVEDGHFELITETKAEVSAKKGDWKPFSLLIDIPKEKLPKHGSVILNLYERGEDGAIINHTPVFLEYFY